MHMYAAVDLECAGRGRDLYTRSTIMLMTKVLFLSNSSIMNVFMSLTVVLAGKCFAANAADEGTLVCMGAQMRPEVVGAGEPLRTESALESCRMLLRALGFW